MRQKSPSQYILLPPRGLSGGDVVSLTANVSSFFTSLETVRTSKAPVRALSAAKIKTKMRVIDSIHEHGAKLVEINVGYFQCVQSLPGGIALILVGGVTRENLIPWPTNFVAVFSGRRSVRLNIYG